MATGRGLLHGEKRQAAGCSGSSLTTWVGTKSERPNRHQPVILRMVCRPTPSMPSAIRHPPAEVSSPAAPRDPQRHRTTDLASLLVEDSITLRRLHEVLQIVMGWQDDHLHQFITGTYPDDQVFYGPVPWRRRLRGSGVHGPSTG